MYEKYMTKLNPILKGKNHELSFKEKCCEFGLEIIENWGNGNKNKKLNCDADFTVKVSNPTLLQNTVCKHFDINQILTVSCKTVGGSFTLANFGTTSLSEFIKILNLTNDEKVMLKNVNDWRKCYTKTLGKTRWDELDKCKDEIFYKYVDCFFQIFNNIEKQKILYKCLEKRQSQLKYVGTRLFIPNIVSFTDSVCVEKRGKDSIVIGDYKLRFKASGGSVKSSWKINVETIQ